MNKFHGVLQCVFMMVGSVEEFSKSVEHRKIAVNVFTQLIVNYVFECLLVNSFFDETDLA